VNQEESEVVTSEHNEPKRRWRNEERSWFHFHVCGCI